jgi:hypothetical protein
MNRRATLANSSHSSTISGVIPVISVMKDRIGKSRGRISSEKVSLTVRSLPESFTAPISMILLHSISFMPSWGQDASRSITTISVL